MTADALRHFLLTGAKRWRLGLARLLKRTPAGRPLAAAYHALAARWGRSPLRAGLTAARRRLYSANPRGYWEREGGSRYREDEAFLLGPGSLTEAQGAWLAEEIRALGARSVLEVGCGYGRLLRELAGRLPGRLVGADFSAAQLAEARRYLGAARLPLVLCDATQGLPFRDGAFDLVYTQGSLMHVPPPADRAYRAEVARVARRHVIHTEDVQEADSMFAHDNAGHYRALGHRLVSSRPYPLNLAGQRMRVEVFEIGGGGRP